MSRSKKNTSGVLQLACGQCPLPAAKIIDGCLVIVSRHHGVPHETKIELTKLLELIAKIQDEPLPHRAILAA